MTHQPSLFSHTPPFLRLGLPPETPAKMPSQLEHCMETVMCTFHIFAGDKNYLTKEDLRLLMEKEVPGYMEVSEEKRCVGGCPPKTPLWGRSCPL